MLILGSLDFGTALETVGSGKVLFVPTAANGLADRDAIVRAYRSQLEGLDAQIVDGDIEQVSGVASVVADDVTAVFCAGGDPYRLLAASRRTGFDALVTELLERGVAYIGASAGALVAGPSLAPIGDVSPFPRPPGFDVTGLLLTQTLVLPHDDHPGRRAAHAAAQSAHGRRRHMIAITDTETVRIDGSGGWQLTDHVGRRVIRPAGLDDAEGIARCYAESARAAWHFLGASRLAALQPPVDAWVERIRCRDDANELLTLNDTEGVAGFVWVRRALDDDLPSDVGEVSAFYTHPRLWGAGAGRRLLELGLDRLRAMGAVTAVLYTEERNGRPRRLYERLGWSTDGVARERRFLDAPIRELRYRRPL